MFVMGKLMDRLHANGHAVIVEKGSIVRAADEEDEMPKGTKVQKENAAVAKHIKGKKAEKVAAKVHPLASPETAERVTPDTFSRGPAGATTAKAPKKPSGLDCAAKGLAEA